MLSTQSLLNLGKFKEVIVQTPEVQGFAPLVSNKSNNYPEVHVLLFYHIISRA